MTRRVRRILLSGSRAAILISCYSSGSLRGRTRRDSQRAADKRGL